MSASAQSNSDEIALTVYNAGTVLIRDQRTLALDEGVNHITLRDIAETIDYTSVMLRSLSDPDGTTVLEQSVSAGQALIPMLLTQNVNEMIGVTDTDGESVRGELLRLDEDKAILRTADNAISVVRLYDIRDLELPLLPADLHSGPALRLTLGNAAGGEEQVEMHYLAGGMNWTADYNLRLNADRSALDLTGMVTLRNQTGRAFNDADIRLVAGAISRIEPEQVERAETRLMARAAADMADESSFVEAGDAGEFKLYEIARPLTIAHNESKQVEFVRGAAIPAETRYVFDHSPAFSGYYRPIEYLERGGDQSGAVLTYLEFSTGDEHGLGADLPAGRIRVYQANAAGAVLIGENHIDHTPQGEDVRLQLGQAFDLVGERKQTDFEWTAYRVVKESIEVRLRNRKADETVEILVPERLYRWRDWQIVESSAPFVKADASSIEFNIEIAPGAEEVLTYTVRYTFPEEEE